MGTRGLAGTTVRAVVEASGLAARYFYESFGSLDALQLAVFDEVAREAAERSLAALDRVPTGDGGPSARAARTRAVLAEVVDLMLEDPRKGRVALIESISSPVLGPRVLAETRRFAGMLAATASGGDPAAVSGAAGQAGEVPLRLRIAARFLIGGVAHALGAVLQGDLEVERDAMVEALTALFVSVDRAERPLE
ncbi:TetR family transcriptional regulator [Nocardioides sp. GY 10113]|nr:TetR family transcriptional regulator [Nocardioides sp. GY 10113]